MSAASRFTPARAGRVLVAVTKVAVAAVVLGRAAAPASPRPVASDVSLRLDPQRTSVGGDIPAHFVGLSLEWTLVDRDLRTSAGPVPRAGA